MGSVDLGIGDFSVILKGAYENPDSVKYLLYLLDNKQHQHLQIDTFNQKKETRKPRRSPDEIIFTNVAKTIN